MCRVLREKDVGTVLDSRLRAQQHTHTVISLTQQQRNIYCITTEKHYNRPCRGANSDHEEDFTYEQKISTKQNTQQQQHKHTHPANNNSLGREANSDEEDFTN